MLKKIANNVDELHDEEFIPKCKRQAQLFAKDRHLIFLRHLFWGKTLKSKARAKS